MPASEGLLALVRENMLDNLQKVAQLFRSCGRSGKAAELSWRARRMETKKRGRLYEILWGYCLGYGERPMTIMLAFLNVIVVFAVGYTVLAATGLRGLKMDGQPLDTRQGWTGVLLNALYVFQCSDGHNIGIR
jgi:hypothetical protein